MAKRMKDISLGSKYYNVLIIFILAIIVDLPQQANSEDEAEKELIAIEKLKEKLLNGYDMNVRPVVHHTNTTVVHFNVMPIHIVQVDEGQSLFHLDCYVFLTWVDYRLTWNPSDYDGIQKIHFQNHLIWQPDIVVYNWHSGWLDPKLNTPLLVNNDGRISYFTPAILITRCPIELKGKYPRDKLNCPVTFGSWAHDGWQIDLQTTDDKMYISAQFSNDNPRWELLIEESNITRSVNYYNCCDEPYVSVVAHFPMSRRPPPELQVIWAPCVLVMALTLTMFWIPSNSSKKIILGGFLVPILCLLTVYVASVTKSPKSIKRAVTFMESTLYAVTTAIILEVVVISLSSICGPYRPPGALVQFLSGPFGKYLAVWASWETNVPGDKMQLKEDDDQQIRLPTPKEEWLLVATALDRLFFVIFIVILAAIHQI